MNYQGTPGRVLVIQLDQNNRRIDLDPSIVSFFNPGIPAGIYNEIVVDANGRIVAGVFVPPPAPPVKQKLPNTPVVYTADPNTEGLIPLDPTQPCVAYSADGTLAMFGWNVDTQIWN